MFENLSSLDNKLPHIVRIVAGWDRYFHDPESAQRPFIDLDLVQELWGRGSLVLCVDRLSPDPTSTGTHGFPVHDFWLGNDGIIVVNLRNLTKLPHQVLRTGV